MSVDSAGTVSNGFSSTDLCPLDDEDGGCEVIEELLVKTCCGRLHRATSSTNSLPLIAFGVNPSGIDPQACL